MTAFRPWGRSNSKYGNRKVTYDGHTFDSHHEAKYYSYLMIRQEHGEISNLRLQVSYELIPAVYEKTIVHLKTKDKTVEKCIQKAVHYIADFVYTDTATGKDVVIDAKGFKTPEYRLKKKMMRAFLGIDIIEV